MSHKPLLYFSFQLSTAMGFVPHPFSFLSGLV
jgi:hypothetical protein